MVSPGHSVRPSPSSPRITTATAGQKRFWFLDQMERHNPFHNLLVPLELHGPLDSAVLERGLQELVRRHEILRTRFAAVDGQPYQLVQPELPPSFTHVELSGLSAPEQEAREAELVQGEARYAFDLEQGPLLRATLLSRGAQEHLLLLALHQMVCDPGSVPVLVEELLASYAAQLPGGAPWELPVAQYAPLAEQQAQWLRSPEAREHVEAWRKRLAEAPQVLALPTDRARPTVQTYNGATLHVPVPGALAADLTAFCRKEQAPLFDVLLAALQAVLHHYSGQAELCIGTPSSLKEEESSRTLGWFGNMLVLRGELRGDPSFRALLARSAQVHQEARQHAAVPFEHLVEALQVERSLVFTPYFQVTFELQERPLETREVAGLRVRQRPVDPDFARYDVSVAATVTGQGLELAFTYNTDLFEAGTLQRLAQHYLHLLRQAVATPDARMSQLPLLSEAERTQVLYQWNDTSADYPRERCIHELISEQAQVRPEAIAVSWGEERLTYGELERRSNQVARALTRRGVGPGQLVGICMERSLELITGLLGILKAGGAYLPLDPGYPLERLRYMLKDAGATVLLTQERLQERLPTQGLQVLALDKAHAELDAEDPLPPAPAVRSAHPAYVIYTSGSTGKPKGVLLAHRSLVNHATSVSRTYQLVPQDRILQCTSISFDISLEEIFPTLASGATLVLMPFERLPSVAEFLRMVEQERLTVLNVPTAYWHEWVADASLRQAAPPPSVRLVIVGGEKASVEQLSAWRKLTQDRVGWVNAYGPTEATITATLFQLPPGSPEVDSHQGIPIGRPVSNARVYLLDPSMQPVPVGVAGELYIGGECLAYGYLGRPELTAERFVPDPFSGEPGARLYRTGDLASYLPDGNIRFLGRVDHQVKVRGFRIELGEIESQLEEHSAVSEAVAQVHESASGQPRLLAYVVPASQASAWGSAVDEQALHAEQISQWQTLYDDAYNRAADEQDAEFNTASWNSSYSGEPIPGEEMQEFVDHTVQNILALKPERVLEIGCGTGLLLVRIAPNCRLFTGADFAQGALRGLQRHVDRAGASLGEVRLLHRAADDFTGIAPGSHDTVVINSVLQHFPTVDYLVKVLEGAVATAGPRGRVFVGDVRGLQLLESFALSVELFRAQDSMTIEQLLQGVRRRVSQDNELVVDPAFFLALRTHLPQIQRVDIWPKRGRALNELTCFRYDVVLHVGEPSSPGGAQAQPAMDWVRAGLTLEKLKRMLREEQPERLRVTNILNARLAQVQAAREVLDRNEALATVGDLRAQLRQLPERAFVHPADLWELEAEFPYSVSLHWSGGERHGELELQLVRHGAPELLQPSAPAPQASVKPWREYTNQPLQAALARQLAPLLLEHLRQRLPEYMVPSAIIALDSLPRTPNGKVDRKALPVPSLVGQHREEALAPPRTPVEELLAGIWTEVLGGSAFGIHDNFFELGGHSLLATQIISRLSRTFGVELPLHALFEQPTIAKLAEKVSTALRTARGVQLLPLVPSPRGQTLPASFAQQRLWFLQHLAPTSVSYTAPFTLWLKGPLDVHALEQSLAAILRRHEALRTTFTSVNEELVQIIHAFEPLPLPQVELSQLPEPEREQRLHQEIDAQVRQPFDLERGPLLRQTLVRLGAEEHVLILTMHHIVSDGWSMGVFLQELGWHYEALRGGLESPLKEPPLQYADFASWQRQWLSGEKREQGLAFWKKQLGTASGSLELPTDRPRAAAKLHSAAIERTVLSPALAEQLQTLSRQEGVTLFMTLLAAFQTLLSRYSGQDDISVGTPIANRNRAELEGLIGFFVNSLVMRTSLAGSPSFRELLRRVREVALDAYSHQDIPFEQVVEALRPERRLDRHPLFQVMFVLQNAPLQPPRLDGLSMTLREQGTGTAKFELILTAEQTEQGFAVAMEYDTDLFEADTIRRMLQHFQTLLAAAVREPERSISTLPLLTDAERQQLLVDWNQTSTDYPRDACIHQLFSLQAQATPDALALRFEEESLTYSQLETRSNQLAWHLQSLGVGPDTLVGLYLERSANLIVSMLACIKAGGAYLPLDTAYPHERIAFMLRDARAPLLLTSSALAQGLELPQGTGLLLLDSQAGALSQRPTTPPPTPSTSASHLAYAIYTSGSTGQPKGIAIPHRGVVRLVRNSDYIQLSPDDRIAQISNASFDAATFEVWGALLNGAQLIGFPRDVTLSPREFASQLKAQSITALFITSALFTQVAREIPTAFSSVHTVLVGGDAADPVAARLVLQHGPPQRLINIYGPTENTTFSTWHLIPHLPEDATSIPIGKPIANSTAFVLDGHLQPVPVGVAGELYLGGDGLGRGYLHQPSLTSERFISNPFLSHSSSQLYKTGDLARLRPDGSIEFLGRRDHQVKLRGFRIELGEIESWLVRHPAVRECVVILREDSPGQRRLAAYFSSPEGTNTSAAQLREFLGQSLPEYMIPAAFVCLPSLPLTSNGKVDRKALPVPDGTLAESASYVAPRSPTEELLANLWAQLLSLPRVSVVDNFFELGGHSLLATQLVSRIRDTLGKELPLRTIFQSPTVAGLAQHLSTPTEASATGALSPVPRERPLEASFAQQRLWFLDQLQQGSAFYNVPLILRLRGSFQAQFLEQSLRQIIQRHEALRTTFEDAGGRLMLRISEQVPPLSLPVVDLTSSPAAGREQHAQELLAAEARKPFDLRSGPLLRAMAIRLESTEHLLLLTIHHIVADGWSMTVLFQELDALYTALAAGKTPELAPLPIQYADFAAWQRQWLQGQVQQPQLSYWKQQLAGAPPLLELPTDRPRPTTQRHHGASLWITLDPTLSESLRQFSRREGVTLFMTLLAAFQTLLSRYSGQDDISVGTPIANRNRAELEGLIGFFVNSLVMRTSLTGSPSFRELLRRVREVALNAYSHQDIPFEQVVEALQPQRDSRYSPLFQVMFGLQNNSTLPQKLGEAVAEPVEVQTGTSKFDLLLSMDDTGTSIVGELEYDTDLFEADTIRRMLQHFQTLLAAAVREPERSISTLPLLTDAERQQLLVDWNQTATDYPRDACIHQLFSLQARATPDALALRFEEESLTYSQLETRSNQLAWHLQSLGVGPDTLVGLYLERSAHLIVSMLACLKAGGAYLPLDTAYPHERIAFMLRDARAPLLLTSSSLAQGLELPQGTGLLLLDSQAGALSQHPTTPPPTPSTSASHLAYAIYTSGSTGQPKGIAIPHRGVVRLVRNSDYIQLSPDDRVAQVSNASFDAATFEIWGALLNGAQLIGFPRDVTLSPREFASQLKAHSISTLFLTTALFNQIAQQAPSAFSSLSSVLFGGELVDPGSVRTILQHGPPKRLLHVYGPTENTTFSSWHLISSPPPEGATVPIGKPLANSTAFVLDERLQPVPVGVPGELYVGGDGLGRGYLHQPSLTSERFIPSPFSSGSPSVLYKTGDIVRRLPEGSIEFLGRRDHQIKLRGFRIELGEIESAFFKHPAIAECIVILREDSPGQRRLVAYFSSSDSPAPSSSQLRDFLKLSLPEYMLPSAFVCLPSLPLTPNGKIDRKALRVPESAAAEESAFIAPSSPLEEVLAEIMAEVLNVPRVSMADNFFELGGHSLLATRFMSLVNEILEQSIPLGTIFKNPTIAAFTEAILQPPADKAQLLQAAEQILLSLRDQPPA